MSCVLIDAVGKMRTEGHARFSPTYNLLSVFFATLIGENLSPF